MATPDDHLIALLHREGVQFESLTRNELWQYQQRWRECYCAALHARTGKWRLGQFEWSTFDLGFARALRDTKALDAYRACSTAEFVIVSEGATVGGLRCRAAALPDLSPLPHEYHVFPPNLEWTMAFTHEGLFYSKQEWLTNSAP